MIAMPDDLYLQHVEQIMFANHVLRAAGHTPFPAVWFRSPYWFPMLHIDCRYCPVGAKSRLHPNAALGAYLTIAGLDKPCRS